MSVLVFAESPSGKLKKSAFEAVTYGKKVADAIGTDLVALTCGPVEGAEALGKAGAAKVLNIADASLAKFDSQCYAAAIAEAANQAGADVVVMAHNSYGKSLAGRVAVRLGASCVSGVNSVPTVDGGFKVKKNVFSGKAVAEYELKAAKKVLSVMPNTFPVEEGGADATVEAISVSLPAPRITVKEVKTVEGSVPLPEADLVVSAGRGLKGPENWGMVEELAQLIGAATACSRPVADVGWRPHHEHVGQTGVAIRPNLYIAIGISGAIQHLAGVNSSKTIVVINKDPEAPFFKAADYGIVGDAFEVVPRLIESVKTFKAGQN